MEDWFSDATPVESVEIDIFFLLTDNLYSGPGEHPDVTPARSRNRLEPPGFIRKNPGAARTTEIVGHESSLAAYYQQVLAVAGKNGLRMNEITHLFWLRLSIWSPDAQVAVSFPWYDTYAEMTPLFDQLNSGDEGEVYSDVDQSWEIEMHAFGTELLVRERDPETEEDYYAIRLPKPKLLTQIAALRDRTEALISRLSQEVGVDPWTRRLDNDALMLPASTFAVERKPRWKFW
jgi:hypothetical protein